jgi:hypothetical protein
MVAGGRAFWIGTTFCEIQRKIARFAGVCIADRPVSRGTGVETRVKVGAGDRFEITMGRRKADRRAIIVG